MKEKRTKIPKWLELVAERDYLDFLLRRGYDEMKNEPPIYRLINATTGVDKKRLADAKKMVRRIQEINKLLAPISEQKK